MAGSLCFAVAAVPGLAAVLPSAVVGAVFVVGSLFFTSAAALLWASTPPWGLDWWAAAIQQAGTLWFNVNTIAALNTSLTVQQEDLRVWTPDMIGSVCFLVASTLALWVVRRERGVERAAAWWNVVGSVFFMAAAITAFIRPATDDAVAAGIANGGTLLGALCFLRGARLLLPESAAPPSPIAIGEAEDTADEQVAAHRTEEHHDDHPPVPPGR